MVKGTVTISIEDFQAFLESAERAEELKESTKLAAKELEVFLSFLCSKGNIEKFVDEFNRQSKTSEIIITSGRAKINFKNDKKNNS